LDDIDPDDQSMNSIVNMLRKYSIIKLNRKLSEDEIKKFNKWGSDNISMEDTNDPVEFDFNDKSGIL